MRISTDPADHAYVDARPRRVWCNDTLIEGWTIADEFRRCVITADGKVHHGSVRIERLLAEGDADQAEDAAKPPPINTGFVGVFVNVPEAKPAAEAVAPAAGPAQSDPATDAPAEAAKSAKRRR